MLLCSDGINHLILFWELKHNGSSFIKIKSIELNAVRFVLLCVILLSKALECITFLKSFLFSWYKNTSFSYLLLGNIIVGL